MPRARKKHAGGRPVGGQAEASVLVRVPKLLQMAVERQATERDISVAEAWRRAARCWVGWHEELAPAQTK